MRKSTNVTNGNGPQPPQSVILESALDLLLGGFECQLGAQVRFVRQTRNVPVIIEPSRHGFTVIYGESKTECADIHIAQVVVASLAKFAGGWS